MKANKIIAAWALILTTYILAIPVFAQEDRKFDPVTGDEPPSEVSPPAGSGSDGSVYLNNGDRQFDPDTGYEPPSVDGGTGGVNNPVSGGTGGVTIPVQGGTGGGNLNVSGGTGGGTFSIQNPLDSRFNSVGGIIDAFLEIFTYLVVLFAVLMLIWVGFQFVMARGNAAKLKELKTTLLWIVVGVAIVIGARIIVGVIINTLEATNIVSPGVIQNANNALRRQ